MKFILTVPTLGFLTKPIVVAALFDSGSQESTSSSNLHPPPSTLVTDMIKEGRDLNVNQFSYFTTPNGGMSIIRNEVNKYCDDNNYVSTTYGPIETWDVSRVTAMSTLFDGKDCNPDISAWDVGNVYQMHAMFRGSTFNQDISCWDTKSVEHIDYLAHSNVHFNQNLALWDVSKVQNFGRMFQYATSFHQNLGCWPTPFWNSAPCLYGSSCGSNTGICDEKGACDSAGGGGDPHFYAFGKLLFSWQGWCDTILLKTPQLTSNGPELLMHIRTRRIRHWSAIDAIAVKVGKDIVEIGSDDSKLLLNGKEVNEIKSDSMPFVVTKSISNGRKHVLLYNFDFGMKNKLEVKVDGRNKFLYTTVTGHYPPGTVGILGSPHSPGLFMRGGTNMTELDINSYVESWQVRDTDEQLFQERRKPQYPQKCEYYVPSNTTLVRGSRRLKETKRVSIEAINNACAVHPPGPMREWCIEDTYVTQDIDSARDSFYG